jgi:isopentenyl-diphosphate Delta-isomerase
MSEQLILVNSNDKITGYIDKLEAHLSGGKRHRAISVFLFNTKGELLLQQRSEIKIVGELQWANTCCGNVLKGETRLQCAYRRLKEELGISEVRIKSIGNFEYHIRCNQKYSEWEIDEVYVGKYDGIVSPNASEVKSFRWVDPKQFASDIRSDKNNEYAPWVIEILNHSEIEKYFPPNNT